MEGQTYHTRLRRTRPTAPQFLQSRQTVTQQRLSDFPWHLRKSVPLWCKMKDVHYPPEELSSSTKGGKGKRSTTSLSICNGRKYSIVDLESQTSGSHYQRWTNLSQITPTLAQVSCQQNVYHVLDPGIHGI